MRCRDRLQTVLRREGGKEEEERLSHSERLWRREGRASGRKRKFFTAAQRPIVSFKLCAKDVRGALHGNSPDEPPHPPFLEALAWISGKVGRKVRQEGAFPWQQNHTSNHKPCGTLAIMEGGN